MRPLLQSIYPFLCAFFCFILPLDKYATAVPNIILIALIVAFPFVFDWKQLKSKLRTPLTMLFGVFTISLFLISVIFHDISEEIFVLKKIAGSFLIFLLFLPLEDTEKIKKAIIVSTLAGIVVSLYHLYFYYMEQGEFIFANGEAINDVLVIDRLYLGLLCVLSIVSSISLIGKEYNVFNRYYFGSIVITALFLLLISSRLAILLLLILFFLRIFYAEKKKTYWFFFGGLVTLLVIAFSLNSNLQDRFFYAYQKHTNKNYFELFLEKEPRVVIWDCSATIAEENEFVFTGLGFHKTKELLVECYDEVVYPEKRRNYFVATRFNTHNQFIDILLGNGILPLMAFSLLFLYLIVKNFRNYAAMAYIITLLSFLFIENIFHRQFGSYIFAIVLIILLDFTLNKKTSS